MFARVGTSFIYIFLHLIFLLVIHFCLIHISITLAILALSLSYILLKLVTHNIIFLRSADCDDDDEESDDDNESGSGNSDDNYEDDDDDEVNILSMLTSLKFTPTTKPTIGTTRRSTTTQTIYTSTPVFHGLYSISSFSGTVSRQRNHQFKQSIKPTVEPKFGSTYLISTIDPRKNNQNNVRSHTRSNNLNYFNLSSQNFKNSHIVNSRYRVVNGVSMAGRRKPLVMNLLLILGVVVSVLILLTILTYFFLNHYSKATFLRDKGDKKEPCIGLNTEEQTFSSKACVNTLVYCSPKDNPAKPQVLPDYHSESPKKINSKEWFV